MRRGLSERGFPNAVFAVASIYMHEGPRPRLLSRHRQHVVPAAPRRAVAHGPSAQRLYADHGSIVRLSVPAQEAVIIFDPEVYMDVHRAGGSCPWGATDALWPLHEYFRLRVAPLPSGPPMAFGSGDWMRVRRGMQKSVFAPRDAAEYTRR